MNEINSHHQEDPPCYKLSESEYSGLLETIGENWRNDLCERLTGLFNDELLQGKHYCLIVPGSDGKKERHPQSKTEIILLLDQNNPQLEKEVRKKIVISRSKNPTIGPLEIKIVGQEKSPLSFFNHSPQRVYPDRVLNSYLLIGDPSLYFKARQQVLEEMQTKKVRSKMRNQLRQYKKAIATGQYRGLAVFSEEKGEQYYFENANSKEIRFGFKIAFLRAVQRKLDLLTINLIKEGKESVDTLAKSLPTNTAARIEYLAQRGFLNQDLAPRLQMAYLWFLKNYHQTQETFSKNKHQIAAVPFNKKRFAAAKRIIIAFVGPLGPAKNPTLHP